MQCFGLPLTVLRVSLVSTTRDPVPPVAPLSERALRLVPLTCCRLKQDSQTTTSTLTSAHEHKLLTRKYNATITSSLLSFKFPPWEKHLFILDSRPRYALTCFKCCFSLKAVSTSHIPLCALSELEPPASVVSISIQPSHMVSHHHIRFHIPVNHSTSTYPSRQNAPHSRWPPLPVL